MTTPFQDFSGIAARIRGANVNTDAIIPAAWLRSAHADFGRGFLPGGATPTRAARMPSSSSTESLFAGRASSSRMRISVAAVRARRLCEP